MATTQQAIDVKYDYYLALRDEKLNTLLSPAVLGVAKQNGLETFEDIKNFTGVFQLDNSETTSVAGIEYFNNITQLFLDNNQLSGALDFSCIINLSYLYANNNQLTSIGNVSGLTELERLIVNDNQLTNVGDLSGLTKLKFLHLDNNNFATEQVDKVLSDMRVAYDATGTISGIYLSGVSMGIPTGGVNNADYVYLINAGVAVTIQTS